MASPLREMVVRPGGRLKTFVTRKKACPHPRPVRTDRGSHRGVSFANRLAGFGFGTDRSLCRMKVEGTESSLCSPIITAGAWVPRLPRPWLCGNTVAQTWDPVADFYVRLVPTRVSWPSLQPVEPAPVSARVSECELLLLLCRSVRIRRIRIVVYSLAVLFAQSYLGMKRVDLD